MTLTNKLLANKDLLEKKLANVRRAQKVYLYGLEKNSVASAFLQTAEAGLAERARRERAFLQIAEAGLAERARREREKPF